jgi:hypothetical protein
MIIIIYEINTGKIIRVNDIPESMKNKQVQEGEAYIEENSYYLDTEYYIDISSEFPIVACKSEIETVFDKNIIIANDIDTATIKKLPDDCIIKINDISYNVIDNIFQLTVTLPGIYNIEIIKFPFLTKEVQIEGIM